MKIKVFGPRNVGYDKITVIEVKLLSTSISDSTVRNAIFVYEHERYVCSILERPTSKKNRFILHAFKLFEDDTLTTLMGEMKTPYTKSILLDLLNGGSTSRPIVKFAPELELLIIREINNVNNT